MQIQNNPYQSSLLNLFNSGNSAPAQSPLSQMMCQPNMSSMEMPPSDPIGLVGYLASQISQLAQRILSLFGNIFGGAKDSGLGGFLGNIGGTAGKLFGGLGSAIGKVFGGLF